MEVKVKVVFRKGEGVVRPAVAVPGNGGLEGEVGQDGDKEGRG